MRRLLFPCMKPPHTIFFKIFRKASVHLLHYISAQYRRTTPEHSRSFLTATVLLLLLLYNMCVSCHRHFFLVLLLKPERWSPPLRLQASHCSTFRIMCDVPSTAVFCSESIEWFPGIVSKFFLKLLVTLPVAPIITGIIVHFRFHIRCISTHKLLYFNFFSASFCTTFLSAGIATSISVHVFSFLFLIFISGLFAVTSLSVCTAWFHKTVASPSSYTGLGMCVYHLSVVSMPKALHIEWCRCAQNLSCLIKC